MATTKKSSTNKSSKKSTTRKKPAAKNSAATSRKTTAKKVTNTKTSASNTTTASSKKAKTTVVVESKKTDKKVKKSRTMLEKLRIWNLVMTVLHAAQGVAVILISQDRLLPVTTDYLTVDTLSTTGGGEPILVPATRTLFDLNVAYIVAAFFFMSAIAHFSIATWYRKRYEAGLQKGINNARWIEYSFSASTMIVAIAMIAGIYDASTLLMMFGLTAVMNLCGLVMERVNQGREKIDWSAYIVGCIAGILPWIVYAFYIYGSSQFGEGGGPPTFVYFILVSIFLFFNVFAINMILQYKKVGKWADYLYGERAYIILSLVAKSALAWQVFAGTLRP